jgi:hypothetical protein
VADAPWRCSQCGTINEPVANACRTCGRWPSLFDLEESKIEDVPADLDVDEADEYVDLESPAPEPESLPDLDELHPEVVVEAPRSEPARGSGQKRRLLARFVIPLGIAAYLLISAIANR